MTAVAGGGMTEQQRERRDSAAAVDLIEHPGYVDMVKDILREAKAARADILYGSDEKLIERQRGSLAVLKSIVLGVYRRANKEPPANIAALFE